MSDPCSFQRREFVRLFALGALGMGFCGPWRQWFVVEAQAQSQGGTGTFVCDLSVAPFTTLQNTNGSIRVRVTGTPASFAEIIITRLANNVFHAVTSRCTHEGQPVNPYNGSFLLCPAHGSRFSASGSVLAGPAVTPLTNYTTQFQATPVPGILRVQIPNLGYRIAGALTPVTGGNQFRLVFPTTSGWKYEVQFMSQLGGASTVVPFATTQGATPNLTVLNGDGTTKTVFVAATQANGFFAIVTKP
ncbi:MAG: Rieske (2Fe-2S) protein [Verrucomicrobiae bacterium]|nr:Rieske (2Fe-2S) protein [Verrucomicrobiae bacterium]